MSTTQERSLYSVVTARGELVAETALHVGGVGGDVDTDLPLAVNGAGNYYIPGTSLAGVLRAWFRAAILGDSVLGSDERDLAEVEDLFGYASDDEEDTGHASKLIVDDAVVIGQVEHEIRDGVGIDRQWGTAAEGIKFDCAVLPRGTRFRFSVRLETANQEEHDRLLGQLRTMLDALTSGGLRVGAATTRGLGKIKLVNVQLRELRFDDAEAFLDGLAQGGRKLSLEAIPPWKPKGRPVLAMEIDWEPVGPVMVKAGYDGMASDMLPMTTGVDGGRRITPVLPGSSIKGALRSRAELIVRTILGQDVVDEEDPRKRFLGQLEVPLVDELFGTALMHRKDSPRARRGNGGAEKPSGTRSDLPEPGRGALLVEDCLAERDRFDPARWADVVAAADDAGVLSALNQLGGSAARWQQAYHVAVDRWTGGAAERMLYTVLEPHGVQWEPIRMTVDWRRIQRRHRMPALALLLCVLRDLATGWIPLGFAANRGMGQVRVKEIRFRAQGVEGQLAKLDGVRWSGQRFEELAADLCEELRQTWAGWIRSHTSLGGSSDDLDEGERR